jgi:hypothetical protein
LPRLPTLLFLSSVSPASAYTFSFDYMLLIRQVLISRLSQQFTFSDPRIVGVWLEQITNLWEAKDFDYVLRLRDSIGSTSASNFAHLSTYTTSRELFLRTYQRISLAIGERPCAESGNVNVFLCAQTRKIATSIPLVIQP